MKDPAATFRRLELDHGLGVTPILIGAGLLAAPPDEARGLLAGRRVFVIAARPVLDLHSSALSTLLDSAAGVEWLSVADGEGVKTPAAAEDLWNRLLAAGALRDGVVVAWGGGTVGDLAGFAAATYLRGVDLVQVPTTLLAQVDAAIGGKTGVNLRAAKNAVGAFHQPLAVLCDTHFLATLPRRELRSGLVEAIKVAALFDLPLLSRIETDLDRLLAADVRALAPVVAASAAAKAAVVAADPREAGERRLLNFGHTIGHALEAAIGYEGLRHGEAVAWGIRFVLRLAERRGLPEGDRRRLETLLGRLEVPPLPADLSVETVLAAVRRDKKARLDGLTWVFLEGLGEPCLASDVDEVELKQELRAFLAKARREIRL